MLGRRALDAGEAKVADLGSRAGVDEHIVGLCWRHGDQATTPRVRLRVVASFGVNTHAVLCRTFMSRCNTAGVRLCRYMTPDTRSWARRCLVAIVIPPSERANSRSDPTARLDKPVGR